MVSSHSVWGNLTLSPKEVDTAKASPFQQRCRGCALGRMQ